ncbi:stage III sporulation protein AC [Clostridium sp. NSJ-6]|uniref:Stage III sporulation protein AC n=2 Tax=Clostridium TaxID=1485 RepID=A0A174GB54_9CLOT|nr:stage III sporulation protein AC [uncultured Clostridium sp.]MBC5627515.1 stage III sporulation protein AC [Clostridium hominis]MDU2672573.1 stage III sporulation protein AC [Clostridium sp.]CUO58140.1 stage III sporulation protein AC [Clostridium disporicum]SCJ54402.1 stage III sporulation protein AC [uncultured Clostridium sp.]
MVLDFSLLFKIGAMGVLLIIIDKVLKSGGREDISVLTNLAGIVIILIAVLSIIYKLFDSVKTLFTL